MQISEKLAFEIYTIEIFHILAVLLIIAFTTYIAIKAKKSSLLFSYMAVVAMITLWMISKILKTVSPNESLRWFFIVTQYFGVQFVGFCLIVFARIYTRDKLPKIKNLILLALPPMMSFIFVITNPWHMKFYSYYDFYKDRFGVLFLPTQAIQYIYLITGIIILSRGFTNQPALKEKKALARFFACVTLVPILFNVYYLLFKLIDVKWIFSFPVFDFTPITSTITLILFMIPALKYRFLDISPISYRHIFDNIPQGIVFLNRKGFLYSFNYSFSDMFKKSYKSKHVWDFVTSLNFENEQDRNRFKNFIWQDNHESNVFLLRLQEGIYYKVLKKAGKRSETLLCFTDITPLIRLSEQLQQNNAQLAETNKKLEILAQNTRELAITRTKTNIAQNVHDILGHSLTVVIGTADLAAMDKDQSSICQKMGQIKELLISSLSDLKNSISGKEFEHTTLIKAISSLKNDNINVDFISQGKPYELNTRQTEAVFRLCQEAVTNSIKHGRAKTIHIILRFKTNEIEVYAIDDGMGCIDIKMNYGLRGIEKRIAELGGHVHFGSDGGKGFNIHASIPKHKYQ